MATSGKLWEIRLVDAPVDKQKFWEITIAPKSTPEAPGIAAPFTDGSKSSSSSSRENG